MDKVKAALPEGITMQPWRMHIFQQQPYPQDYNAFKKQRGKAQPPLAAPIKLPACPAREDVGELPSVTELQRAIKAAFKGSQTAEVGPMPCGSIGALSSCMVTGKHAVMKYMPL